MNTVKRVFVVLFSMLFLSIPATSYGLKAKHVIEDMDGKEAAKFVSGMVTMLQYLQYRLGQPERGQCIYDWYFKDDKTPETVMALISEYPEGHSEAIIYILAKNACFKKKESDGS